MIDKNIARGLLPLVNIPDTYTAFQEYVEYRIKHLQKQIETSADLNTILRVQGQIAELRRLEKLKEEVQADSK